MSTRSLPVPLLVGSLLAAGCPGDDTSTTTNSQASSTGDEVTGTTDDFETTDAVPDTTTDQTTGGDNVCDPPCGTNECCVAGLCFDDDPPLCEPPCVDGEFCADAAGADSCANEPGVCMPLGDDTTSGSTSCAASGSYTVPVSGILDPFSHLAFLLLWFNQAAMDSSGMEEVNVTIDGMNVSMSVSARDMGSGSGHAGVPEVSGTIDESDCSFSISGEVPYSSDMGDFGMVTVDWTGVADPDAIVMTCSLSGGGIPSGPIEYMLDFAPQ